jgi:hypothetical protein
MCQEAAISSAIQKENFSSFTANIIFFDAQGQMQDRV